MQESNYTTDYSLRLQGYPEGWFAVAFSQELKPGKVLRRKLMNQDLVVYRTESGKAVVQDAFCPHLGAHLAEGGKIKGEELECPFHGFRFDTNGVCTSTPYGKRVPKICNKLWHTEERHGVLLCFYSHSKTADPSWQVKSIEPEHQNYQWSSPVGRLWRIRTHPQEIIENTVDIGHFGLVHDYRSVETEKALNTDGPHLNMGYFATRNRGLLGRHDPNKLKMHLDINASGVGYSRVQVRDETLGLSIRLVVMPTPINNEEVEVRVVTQVAELPEFSGRMRWLSKLVPRTVIAKALAHVAAIEMGHDFTPDTRIWENKRFNLVPKLAPGDGPIVAFREWVGQFYVEDPNCRELVGRVKLQEVG